MGGVVVCCGVGSVWLPKRFVCTYSISLRWLFASIAVGVLVHSFSWCDGLVLVCWVWCGWCGLIHAWGWGIVLVG